MTPASPLPPDPMTPVERRTTLALSAVFAMRMMGLFVILPVFAIYGHELRAATPLLIGLAIGAYGLMQGILQIPWGILSDRYGRKPMIYAGLLLFAAGGLVAAASDSIWGVIAGRALQGSGAVAGVVMALLTDLTRESHRTRAMATIGATVGLSFGLAMVLGPLIVAGTGLQGLFLFTALMAVASLLIIMFAVPTPVSAVSRDAAPVTWRRLYRVLTHPGLFRLDLGVFLLHMVMTAVFVVVPLSLLHAEQLPAQEHWKVYLPVILGSLVVMVPLMVMAERRGRWRQTLVGAGALLVLSLLVLAFGHRSLAGIVGGLFLYFTAFNLLEALMPSLVSRLSPAGARGTSMGVYSSGQFLGAFAGGVLGGGLSGLFGTEVVLLACAVIMSGWVLYVRSLRLRVRTQSITVELAGPVDAPALAARLQALEGVVEAIVVPEDGVAYLRVDGARFDRRRLNGLLA